MGDYYKDKFVQPSWPLTWPPIDSSPYQQPLSPLSPILSPAVTREEFDELKKAVEEMKNVLLRAKEYDEKTGQPDCEMEDKVDVLKKIAKLVGVDLSEVFGSRPWP